MIELKSKCCGAKVEYIPDSINAYTIGDYFIPYIWVCKKCSQPALVLIALEEEETCLKT